MKNTFPIKPNAKIGRLIHAELEKTPDAWGGHDLKGVCTAERLPMDFAKTCLELAGFYECAGCSTYCDYYEMQYSSRFQDSACKDCRWDEDEETGEA